MNGLLMKYFVLKPKGSSLHALASREAMRVYADAIEINEPLLAKEVREWVTREARDCYKEEKK